MTTRFAVKTADGYVGRYTITENLRGDMPAQMAYCYDTADDAGRVADSFDDGVVIGGDLQLDPDEWEEVLA